MAAFPFNGMKHPRKHRAARDKTEITHRARAHSYLDELHNARKRRARKALFIRASH